MRRRTTLVVQAVAAVAALSLVLAACGGGGGEKKTQKKAAPPDAVQPLTGLTPAGDSLTRPALEVKIDNADERGVRPQAGIDVADVVYEEQVEGNVTRFLTIFNSTVPDQVGPIRSVRATDPNVVWPLGGVFAYSGGAPQNVDLIHQAPVNAIDESGAGNAMFRDRSRPAPHNLFGHPADLVAKGGQPVPPKALFQYLGKNEQPAGDPAAAVHLGFIPPYDPTYTYDAASNTWKRTYGLAPFTSASGQQVAPTNVVVQLTNYEGGAGNPTAEGQTVGQGDVVVFTGGKVVRGRWNRPAKEQPAQYVDAAGKPIKLQPGRTWVELLPIGAAVDVTAPAPAPPSS
ncbi:MAG TPA: DUF3048 domain-containing protein [Acidimicrobiia bacterium]|nr:DUF3048 domain-containing protein [Acidimicrobiia bacterium]